MLDDKLRCWIFTSEEAYRNTIQTVPADWRVKREELDLVCVNAAQADEFFGNLVYRYGIQEAVMDTPDHVISIAERTTIPAEHFNRSAEGHEVANPEFWIACMRYNQVVYFDKIGCTIEKYSLMERYLNALKDTKVILPATGPGNRGDKICLMQAACGQSYHIAYTDHEAIPDAYRKDGYLNGVVQPLTAILASAREKGQSVLVNGYSRGGGIWLRGTEMDVLEEKMTMDEYIKKARATDLFYAAEAYRMGQNVPMNLSKARELYEGAAELGMNAAMNNLAVLIQNGYDNVPPDLPKAMAWYEKAAPNNAMSAFTLGRIYDGSGLVETDLSKAAGYYQMAAKLGEPQAMFNLGHMYLNDEGVPKDEEIAMEWIRKAGEAGNPSAVAMLAKQDASGKP